MKPPENVYKESKYANNPTLYSTFFSNFCNIYIVEKYFFIYFLQILFLLIFFQTLHLPLHVYFSVLHWKLS